MAKGRLRLVDVTDVLRHILATGELGGIPRLLVSIIEAQTAIPNLRFCVFDAQQSRFLVVGQTRSLDLALLDQLEFTPNADNIQRWIDLCKPDLLPVEAWLNDTLEAHYYFLSTQWDTFPPESDFAFFRAFLAREHVTCLLHDQYLLTQQPESAAAVRFEGYWRAVVEGGARKVFISSHTRQAFEQRFGKGGANIKVPYDFAFAYPRGQAGVDPEALSLVVNGRRYLLVFSVLDGRKAPLPLVQRLVAENQDHEFEIVLIVRFANDDMDERVRLMDLVVEHGLRVFLAPNDSSYLWLIRYAHAVFYPSVHEGYGMVPLDCKRYGKACFCPVEADFTYLHDNIVTYEQNGEILPQVRKPRLFHNDLNAFRHSTFAQGLFELGPVSR